MSSTEPTKFSVDSANKLINNRSQVLVFFDITTTGHCHLNQNNASDPVGVFGQEYFQRMQFLRHTLDVIQSVNADDKLHTLEFALQCLNTLDDLRLLQAFSELLRVDADWECADSDNLAFVFNAVGCCRKAPMNVSIARV